MDKFTFHKKYYDVIRELSDADQLAIYRTMCEATFDDKPSEIDGLAGGIYELIKPDLNLSIKRSKSGKKGGSKTKAPKEKKEQPKTVRVSSILPSQAEIPKKDIYVSFSKFMLTNEQYDKLIRKGHTKTQIDEKINKFKSYGEIKQKKYSSLYNVLLKWLPAIVEQPKWDLEFNEFVKYLNLKKGSKHKLNKDVQIEFLKRKQEGTTLEDFKAAIDNAIADEFQKKQKYVNLTTEYLTRTNTIERYANVVAQNKDQLIIDIE